MFLNLLLPLRHTPIKSQVLMMYLNLSCKVYRVKIFQKVPYLTEDLIFQYVFVENNGLVMLIIGSLHSLLELKKKF